MGWKYAHRGGSAQLIIEKAKALGLAGDPVWRQRLAELWAKETISATSTSGWCGGDGRPGPGPEGSILKLAMGEFIRLAAQTGADLTGAGGSPGTRTRRGRTRGPSGCAAAPASPSPAGPPRCSKNLAAERVLGLPRDMVDDRDVPFDEWIRRAD